MEQTRYLKWNKKDKQQTVVEQKQGDIKFNLLTVYHIVTQQNCKLNGDWSKNIFFKCKKC